MQKHFGDKQNAFYAYFGFKNLKNYMSLIGQANGFHQYFGFKDLKNYMS